MRPLALKRLDSLAALRAAAPLWDDLWWRSDTCLPTMRAELLAQWIETFARGAPLEIWVVEEDGRYLAALPLLRRRLARFIPVAALPGNYWSSAGDLLADPQADQDEVLDLLVTGLREADVPLMWLDAVELSASRWRTLCAAAERAGLLCESWQRGQVGRVEIRHDWEAYFSSRSTTHRRHLRKSANRAASAGQLELKIFSDLSPAEVGALLRRGFEIEDRGWKGVAGSSVLRSSGMFEFYLRQAQRLAAWHQLEIVFLELNGQPIAFEYGWSAKRVYGSVKVGYDESFQRFAPGQLLRERLLEQFHGDPRRAWVDYLGPLSDATARWSTCTYDVSRLVIGPRRPLNRMLLHAYKNWWPKVRRVQPTWVGQGIAEVIGLAPSPRGAAVEL